MQRQAQRREHASHKCIRSQEQQSTAFVSLPSAARLECIRTDCCGRHGANAPMWAAKRPTARCCDLCGRRNTDAQPALLSDGNGGRGLCRAGCVTYSRVYCCDSLSACLPARPLSNAACVRACAMSASAGVCSSSSSRRWLSTVDVRLIGRHLLGPPPARHVHRACVRAGGPDCVWAGWLAGWQCTQSAPPQHTGLLLLSLLPTLSARQASPDGRCPLRSTRSPPRRREAAGPVSQYSSSRLVV